jgi:hypothetical protein
MSLVSTRAALGEGKRLYIYGKEAMGLYHTIAKGSHRVAPQTSYFILASRNFERGITSTEILSLILSVG